MRRLDLVTGALSSGHHFNLRMVLTQIDATKLMNSGVPVHVVPVRLNMAIPNQMIPYAFFFLSIRFAHILSQRNGQWPWYETNTLFSREAVRLSSQFMPSIVACGLYGDSST